MSWSSVDDASSIHDDIDEEDLPPSAPPRRYKDMPPRDIFGRIVPVADLSPVALGVALCDHKGLGPNELSFHEVSFFFPFFYFKKAGAIYIYVCVYVCICAYV